MIIDRPRILCISGHDPSGGAGIHADIESVAANGGHAVTAITALTIQDSQNVSRVQAVSADWLAEQVGTLANDGPIAAIKIGLIGDQTQIATILNVIEQLDVPVVLDPVLRAGGGAKLVDDPLLETIRSKLLPRVTVLTPNVSEARKLIASAARHDEACIADAAIELLQQGCHSILITGGDEVGPQVENLFFESEMPPRTFTWARLPETFHGAGCTLASAVATHLALGASPSDAVAKAQQWTQQTLSTALRVGHGRRIPGRSVSPP